jgi:type II secretory pathway pseudopilin PulG
MNNNRFHKQSGATLMEVLIAMTISLVVTAAMIAMMSNTLGTTARIIQMTKLQDDLRVAMQMMTRDIRRSNFNADSMYCFANDDCGDDGSITTPREIFISDSNDCFWFVTDREADDFESDLEAGAFRLVPVDPATGLIVDPNEVEDAVGAIEMWTGTGEPPASVCDTATENDDWVQITDPSKMDISNFVVVDDEPGLSYSHVIKDDGAGDTLIQRVRKVRMNVQANLVLDESISRTVEDIITVRNDVLL